MPPSKFCKARAKAKTSRPQWCALDIGVRKNPSVERGPKAIIAIRQPEPMTSDGVRQLTIGLTVVVISPRQCNEFPKSRRSIEPYRRSPKRKHNRAARPAHG